MSTDPLVLGVDIGATGVKGNIVNTLKGEVISERLKILTPHPATPDAILTVINEIIEHFEWKGKKIGIGIPAITKAGRTFSASNIDQSWLGFHAEQFFKEGTGSELKLVNDADAAGIAEMQFGIGKGEMGSVILITLGTGIGSALFYDGQLIPNTEFGHLFYKDSIFEKYASNKAREDNDWSWKKWGKHLNRYIQHLDFILSPDLIIIGGGISKHFEKYREYLNQANCRIVAAANKNDAGIIGAALAIK